MHCKFNCITVKYKTGLQPVSSSVEQVLWFYIKILKRCKNGANIFWLALCVLRHCVFRPALGWLVIHRYNLSRWNVQGTEQFLYFLFRTFSSCWNEIRWNSEIVHNGEPNKYWASTLCHNSKKATPCAALHRSYQCQQRIWYHWQAQNG